MTVGQLLKIMENYDPDAEVVIMRGIDAHIIDEVWKDNLGRSTAYISITTRLEKEAGNGD